MGNGSKNHIDGTKCFPFARCFLPDYACMVIVHARNFHFGNGLKELIDNLDFFIGFGSLVEFDRNGSCIIGLVKFKISSEFGRYMRFFFSEKFNPNRDIDEHLIGHDGFSPMCCQIVACLHG